MARRFPPPWIVEPTSGGWCVKDANGQTVAFTYGREHHMARSDYLTVEEARRIAVNIARLPELLAGKSRG